MEGVYFIGNGDREAVYIGEAQDIQLRLMQHITGRNSEKTDCIRRHHGSQFCYWFAAGGKSIREGHQNTLIRHFRPLCNLRPLPRPTFPFGG